MDILSISSSALKAERIRMQTIAENIANMNTTRTEGEIAPYCRKEVVFQEVYKKSLSGVEATEVLQDSAPFVKMHKPGHPDADKDGYVLKPNVDLHFEMVDLISASRSYQANLVAMKLSKDMIQKTLNMG
ncbi:MAG: flagellar basal body rod protein FlgC [Candidatus Brocadiae bacterium]|nr:flagellar basal body rod protein FlgC [Candidatus Brocadiia bacterium]